MEWLKGRRLPRSGLGLRKELGESRNLLPPPLAAELGFTRVRPLIKQPKSDKSDFGWRDGEGAAANSEQASPLPNPPPQAGEGTSMLPRHQNRSNSQPLPKNLSLMPCARKACQM